MEKNLTQNKGHGFGIREFISLVLRWFVGYMFISAAIEKILNPEGFYYVLREYQMLPDSLEPAVAILLPWVEVVAGVLLVLGAFYRSSGLAILVMMVVFEVAIIYNLIVGNNLEDCGCGLPLDFLGIEEKVTWGTVGRDMVFLLMAVEITFWSKPRFALDQVFDRVRKKKEEEEKEKEKD
jgi:putative oxidoreductase